MSQIPPHDDSSRRNPAGELHAQMKATRADFERQLDAKRLQFDQANERLQERTGRNIISAVVIGVALGGFLVLSLVLVKALFMVFAGVLLGMASFELATALRKMGRRVPRTPAVATTLAAIPAAYFWGILAAAAVIAAGVGVTALWRLIEARWGGHPATRYEYARDIGAATFVQGYVSLLGAFVVALVAQDGGQWWALAFLLIVISVDTGAYVSGLNFGKHPMAPKISPKKTWEGFAGAALFAMVVGILLSIFMLDEAWWFGIIFGLIILTTATLGDLGESHLKRRIGVKDMSSWLAGHGGFLDRLDSILPSSLAAFVVFMIVTR
jgi:phosphatidate cytidylyltransferase